MQLTVTLQVLVVGGLVCLWLLLKVARAIMTSLSKLRQPTEEYRKLNEQWSGIRTARGQWGECPHCASPLSGRDGYIGTTTECLSVNRNRASCPYRQEQGRSEVDGT